jgi:hypothetical protein
MMASVLVHELTHARHTELRVREDVTTRARRELHCIREQIRFAKRLGDDRLVALNTGKLATPLPGPTYYERLYEEVRLLQVPRAIAWLMSLLIERRRRQDDAARSFLPALAPEARPRRPRLRRANFERRR